MQQTLVLSVGTDSQLLGTRNAVLRQAGYFVTPAHSALEALEKFFGGDFDLVVICHSVPVEEQQKLAELIHRFSPSVPVVVIVAESENRSFADAQIPNDPHSLIRELPILLGGSTDGPKAEH